MEEIQMYIYTIFYIHIYLNTLKSHQHIMVQFYTVYSVKARLYNASYNCPRHMGWTDKRLASMDTGND